jgi:stearoyl-CoA desaturase (delta-9 desaturase)
MKKILISNTIMTQLFLIVSIFGSIYGYITYDITLETILIPIFGYFLYVCLGVVVMFHRKLTHKSYTTYNLIEKIFTFLGCMANTGSSIAWVAIHLKHHLHSDKKDDPHSPWVLGWKIFLLKYSIDNKIKWRMRDLITDPYHRFLHKYYYAILLFWSLILYILGGLYLVIFLHLVPIVISAIMSNVVNYAGHKESWWGSYRRYKLSDHSCNNWIWAIPTWGEGWHNNHHRYPKRYSCGEKWWEFDVSAYIIKLIKK